MVETGLLDLFILPGPTVKEVISQFAHLTGTPPIPQLFAIGYHQCRWNYKDEDDVKQVNGKFNEHDIPYDVLWLDIEHTDDKKYFTWDSHKFPKPVDMQNLLSSDGRKVCEIFYLFFFLDGYHFRSSH
jgi:mannosyl-oligosaccharide alpha-1,3-glucosidase